ncbi:MAG: TOBE domain-containing protein [Sulfuritalea sp.]|jgi:molybdate transport system regulatory protein|nr:TOBE domain-containing protein [Sulfuritalea sp.]MDP1981067.1 TOBE domain-containing protein [Sulfuritalea sp.]
MKKHDTPTNTPSLAGGRKVDRVALLERVAELGSITAAAKAVGISYKGAWEAIEALNNLSDAPLVERSVGGSGGGGTRLTAHGEKVLSLLRDMDTDFQGLLAALSGGRGRFDRFYKYFQVMRRWNMKTSARNQFLGIVTRTVRGAVNSEVILDIGGGDSLACIITNTSLDNLGLAPGVEAYALIKAPWVIVTTDEGMKTSARNRLCGVVSRCVTGAVNGEVIIDLPGGKSVAAIITNDSIEGLGLKVGVRACALIKASHIILAVNS